jgi:hypothetical protein
MYYDHSLISDELVEHNLILRLRSAYTAESVQTANARGLGRLTEEEVRGIKLPTLLVWGRQRQALAACQRREAQCRDFQLAQGAGRQGRALSIHRAPRPVQRDRTRVFEAAIMTRSAALKWPADALDRRGIDPELLCDLPHSAAPWLTQRGPGSSMTLIRSPRQHLLTSWPRSDNASGILKLININVEA